MRVLALIPMTVVLGWACPAAAQSSAAFPDPPAGSRPTPTAPAFRPAVSEPAFTAEPRPSRPLDAAPSSWDRSPGGTPEAVTASPVAAPAAGGYWSGGTFSFGASPSATPARDSGTELSVEEGPATTPLVIGGIALGLPYATGLGIAAAEDFDNGSGWLAAPVAGPWLALSGRRDPCADAADKTEMSADVGKCVAEPMIRGMLVLDGVLQAAGAVLLVIGANSSETRIVRKEPSVMAAPTPIGRSGYGFAMAGRF